MFYPIHLNHIYYSSNRIENDCVVNEYTTDKLSNKHY